MSDKFCLVTGTSAGLGLAVARTLLERGWEVLGIARRPAPLHEGAYRHVTLDLADVAAVERYFLGDFAAHLGTQPRGRVGLVNNAGLLTPVGPLERVSAADLARTLTVNTAVPAWLSGFFQRRFRGTPLRIVHVSSGAAHNASAGWGAYCTSKAGLLMAGRVLAEEAALPGTGGDVAIVSYAPGTVDTAMQTQARGADPADFPRVQRFIDLHARGELIPPEQSAARLVGLLEADTLPRYSEVRYGD